MALRGKEETFVRRFAAGGNDGVPFNPRGYGDHSRRFAARGNEIVFHENFRESCDGYHPRRFAARGNGIGNRTDGEIIYDSSPKYDEYMDEEWYSWFTGMDQNVLGDESGSKSRKVEGFTAGESSGVSGSKSLIVEGSTMVERGGATIANSVQSIRGDLVRGLTINCWSRSQSKVIPTFMPEELGFQTKDDLIKGYNLVKILIQKEKISWVYDNKFLLNLVVCTDPVHEINEREQPITKVNTHIYISGLIHVGMVSRPTKHQSSSKVSSGGHHHAVDMAAINYVTSNDDSHGLVKTSAGLQDEHKVSGEPLKKKRFNAPFDLGGTYLGSSATTREVNPFLRVMMIIIIHNQVDVPFDPGGFDYRQNSRTSFFEDGENDADYLLIRI